VPRDPNEPVRLTRIYTRGGDAGETSLGDGSRVSKLDPRIRAYGITDELNSQLGVVLAGDLPERLRATLTRVQNELFDVGADLSVPFDGPDDRLRTTQEMIDRLEQLCDEFNAELPELKSFILPGGTEAAPDPCRTRDCPPRRARRARGGRQSARPRLPEPRFRPALHPRARRECTRRREEPLWRPGA
jgi:cob(I)alamin adenosyltransferase